MNKLVAIVYDDQGTAQKAFDKMKELQDQYVIELEDMAYVTRNEKGKLEVHQGSSPAAAGAAGGAIWGLLIGMIFFAPFLGAAVGAATGAATGAMADYGIDDAFIKELTHTMTNDSSALFVLFRNANPDKVVPEISQFGGKVLKTSLTTDAERKLQHALAHGAARI